MAKQRTHDMDSPYTPQLRDLIQRAQQGAAVIISSHLLAMVEDICSHVLVLNEEVRRDAFVQYTARDDLFSRPPVSTKKAE